MNSKKDNKNLGEKNNLENSQEEEEECIEVEVEDRGVNTDELSPEELQFLVDNNPELKEENISTKIEREVKNDKITYNPQTKPQLNYNDYIFKIEELKKQLNDEKNKNQRLIKENDKLKEKINILNIEINSNNSIKQLKDKIKLLEKDLTKKNNEIQQLLSQKNKNQGKYKITSINPGEEVLSLNFVSMGNSDIGHYSLVCKNTDLFVREEERLYEKFPQFKKLETFFEVNGKRIKRFLTLDENKIKDNDIINIFIIEE